MITPSATLARFTHRLQLADVPAAVVGRAKHLILDAIGCALAARGEDFASRFAAATQALSGKGSDGVGARGVIGLSRRLPLRDAAMLNGILAHGLDYDDTHMAGIVHLSVSVLPTVLGVCADRDQDGAGLLTAYIAGLETGARIAAAARGGFHRRGFHPTGLVGAFASTLAAGRAMGLAADQLASAQGIALSMASGSLQFLEDGAWTKRLHPGWAAQAGITAATFASQDIPAPLAGYEGRFGLYALCLDDGDGDGAAGKHGRADLSLLDAGLSADGACSVWELANIAVKPFPVCHFSHACADAAIVLHRAGIDTGRIRAITALLPAGALPVVCEPIEQKRRPQTDYDAKFSLPYAVASGLLRGRLGLAELTPAAFNDPAALALMDKVCCEADPASTFPRHYSGGLRLTLDDGRVIEHREAVNRGHAERPLSDAQVQEKFLANAGLHFPRSHAEAIVRAVLTLDAQPSVRDIERLLARAPSELV